MRGLRTRPPDVRKPGPPELKNQIGEDGFTGLDRIGKGKRGQPIPASKTGKKAKALSPEEEFEQINAEVKEAVPPAARPVDSPDAGTTGAAQPKRK